MKRIFLTLASVFMLMGVHAQSYPFQNPNLSSMERAKDLCSRLTLEEKVRLMQNDSPAIDRLGVPAFNWWNEALHGVGRNGTATVFPITMAMAATFRDDLVQEAFTMVSDEARVKNNQAKREGRVGELYHNLSFYTPNINIFRDPRWGRGQETYGEDPYLTAQMGLAVVRGLQGPDDAPYRKLLACAKHYAVHSGPEWNRHTFDVENLPQRDLYETYLPAFKSLVMEGNVEEVMCAYNRFEGKPCCGSDRLLYHILRDEWGYKGMVTSDCGAITNFYRTHKTSKDVAEASATAVKAGTDLTCGDEYIHLPEAVKRGDITEDEIDVSLIRLLDARFRLGDMTPDEMVSWTKVSDDVVACDRHRALAQTLADKSIVLLQNNNHILPLNASEKIILMGPNANDSIMQWGNYNGFPKHTVTMLEAIKRKTSNVTYLAWDKTKRVAEMAAEVPAGSKVVFVGGISPQLEGEEMEVDEPGFRGGDRNTIELPAQQRALIAELKKAGCQIIFVNCSGSAIGLLEESERCEAVLQAWYGGEKGGEALANVLYGDVNPSGKLPVTFYKGDAQLPDFQDYTMTNRTYRYMHAQPLYAFGYGQSYTTFALGKAKYADGKVTVKVKNTGAVDGSEVVQVYIRRADDNTSIIRTLRAYKSVDVASGATAEVEIALPREKFEWWDDATNTMRVLPGTYEVYVGTSSRTCDLQKIKVKI